METGIITIVLSVDRLEYIFIYLGFNVAFNTLNRSFHDG